MRIEKSIQINRKPAEIFEYLKFTRNQDNFSTWNMADPLMKKEFSGEDGTIGFTYRWDSNNKNVGAGEQETKGLKVNERIDFEIRFSRPMQNTGKSSFIIEDKGYGVSIVSWTFESPSKFPMSLFSPIFKIMLGRDIYKGLENLKTILEKK